MSLKKTCQHCGRSPTKEGFDGCLGLLPGVVHACCGHGNSDLAYIAFEGGVTVSRFSQIEIALVSKDANGFIVRKP